MKRVSIHLRKRKAPSQEVSAQPLSWQIWKVSVRQRWATATLEKVSLPLSLFAENNSGATLPVTKQK